MKQLLNIRFASLVVFIFINFISNAAIVTNGNPIDEQKLIVANDNLSLNSSLALEDRTFKIGDNIYYNLEGKSKSHFGTIVGFEEDIVLIKNSEGINANIPLNQLKSIQHENNLRDSRKSLHQIMIVLGTLVLLGSISLFTAEPSGTNSFTMRQYLSLLTIIFCLIGLPIILIISWILKKREN